MAQQLGGNVRCNGHRWCRGRGVCCGLCLSNLCALFVKLVRGELGKPPASVRHECELDAKREVSERLELVVASWYDLLALFPAVAKEHRTVPHYHNHGDAFTELRQDLFDQPSVGFVKADVNGGKRLVKRREILRFGELALCARVREFHRGLTT